MRYKVMAVLALAFSVVLSMAQGPAPAEDATGLQKKDLQEKGLQKKDLQEKVKQLEQETEELKARIASLERRQAPASAPAQVPAQMVDASIRQSAPPANPPLSGNVAGAAADVAGGLQPKENIALAAPKTSTAQTDPKTETAPTMNVYGFAMLDMGYDAKVNDPAWFDVNRPSKLPSTPGQFGQNGNTYFGVRQSRIGVQGTLPTAWGDAKYKFEWDLFGVGRDAGLTTIRPRHFYGELGPVLAGQTNSVFMDIDVFPNILDYWGPNGMVFLRNPQFRWMPVRREFTHLWISLEAPGQSGDQGVLSDREPIQNIKPRFQYPDVAAQFRYGGKQGYFQVAGVMRNVQLDDTLPDAFDLNQSIMGWGFNASSGLKFHKDVLHLQYVVGNGIENYMNDAPFDVGPIANPGNPIRPVKGKPLPMWSYVIYLDHNWSEKWATSLGYSALQIQNPGLQAANAFHRGQYSTINLLYSPTKHIMYGGELQWARRVNFLDGFDPQDFRVQFGFKYSFDARVFGKQQP